MPQSAQSEVLIRISRIILPEEAEISIKAKNIRNFDIFFLFDFYRCFSMKTSLQIKKLIR